MIKVIKQINKNNPSVQKPYSNTLAKVIVEKSHKYKISPKILAAMLMQESAYNTAAKNVRCGISVSNGNRECVIIDFGIGQINYKTIKHFKFDQKKLLSNLDYSVEAAAIVLSDFKRMYGNKEVDYWSRYNASTPSKRRTYKVLVSRYM